MWPVGHHVAHQVILSGLQRRRIAEPPQRCRATAMERKAAVAVAGLLQSAEPWRRSVKLQSHIGEAQSRSSSSSRVQSHSGSGSAGRAAAAERGSAVAAAGQR